MKIIQSILILFLMILLFSGETICQIGRGDPTWERTGVMRGNQVRTVFTNSGVIAQPASDGPRGAWKYDNNGYIGDVSPLIGVRLPIKDYGLQDPNYPDDPTRRIYDGKPDTIHSVIITNVQRPGGGDYSPGGQFWGFEPIPGFCNQSHNIPGQGVAMSDNPDTWPPYWPDHPDWIDTTGKAEWNGYFGRGQISADEECYFMMDDQRDEKMFVRYGFLPDSTDPTRKGQAIQVKVRALQWANPLAENTMFWLYDVKNVGTSIYDQTVFGLLVGTYVGIMGSEYNDDASFFNIRESITYTWDFDHYISPSANPYWKPNPSAVGYVGYAFLESPGNQFDGIDNDNDDYAKKYFSFTPNAILFTPNDFDPKTVQAGDKLILINRNGNGSLVRSNYVMPDSPVDVTSLGKVFHLVPGVTQLVEGDFDLNTNTANKNAQDGIDNNLNGLIDENYSLDYRQYKASKDAQGIVTKLIDTIAAIHYKNFLTETGVNDLMIDEARDDGIDNDGDWSRDPVNGDYIYDQNGHLIDDVGADGKPDTHDLGEYDGVPTPGEPNFDGTDVDESDQLGLTSFQYFVPANAIAMNDEEGMWTRLRPGFFDVPTSIVNNRAIRGEDGDFDWASGYFPLLPGQTERFSLALCFGDDYKGVIKTKQVAQIIYNANYKFPKPPDRPTLNAVPGDGFVTLYWDKVAENSVDPLLKEKDFEGYKIYKGTDIEFSDSWQISDGTGQKKSWVPIAQFDLKDGVSGYFVPSSLLNELNNGLTFYLGEDNGIQNSYTDYGVVNGRTYYYAVVAYDKGKASADIFPSENNHTISQTVDGSLILLPNTAAVTPNAPVSGYVPPENSAKLTRASGISTPVPYYTVIDPNKIKNATYEVSFIDSSVSGVNIAYAYNVVNLSSADTLIKKSKDLLAANGDVFDGLQLSIDPSFQNLDSISLNASNSGWNHPSPANLLFTATQFKTTDGSMVGIRYPYDYALVFSDAYADSSNKLPVFGTVAPPARLTNFKAYDITDQSNPVRIQYGFTEPSAKLKDTLSNLDRIFLSNSDGTTISWSITFTKDSANVPKGGDTLYLRFYKPFTHLDKFTFITKSASFNADLAKEEMKNIRVVPNPYVASDIFEKPLPSTQRGRGERIVNFINVPPNGKIYIYASNGSHVRTLQHDNSLSNGSVTWDLRTKEGLDIAFGIYFYIVEVDGIGEKKTGKIAIIK
jgi:hypothetical protein